MKGLLAGLAIWQALGRVKYFQYIMAGYAGHAIHMQKQYFTIQGIDMLSLMRFRKNEQINNKIYKSRLRDYGFILYIDTSIRKIDVLYSSNPKESFDGYYYIGEVVAYEI